MQYWYWGTILGSMAEIYLLIILANVSFLRKEINNNDKLCPFVRPIYNGLFSYVHRHYYVNFLILSCSFTSNV